LIPRILFEKKKKEWGQENTKEEGRGKETEKAEREKVSK
jgi:hypothetical protein